MTSSDSPPRPVTDSPRVRAFPPGPVPIFANPAAGMGGNGRAELEREARALDLPVEIRMVEPALLAARLREAVEKGLPVVGVAGGDGSLRTAANILCDSDTILAPIPAGTLNRFCRRLGIFSTNQALYWISQGAVEQVPVGKINGEIFLNTAVFGFYSDIVRRRERLRPWLTKWPAAAVSAALYLARTRWMDVTVEIGDGETIRRTTPMLWIGLGGGSFPFVHRAPRPSGPNLLEVAIVRTTTRRGIAGVGLRLLGQLIRRRKPIRLPKVEMFRASQIALTSRGRIGVTLDGEPLRMEGRIVARAVEGGLHVVAPSDPTAGRPEDPSQAGHAMALPHVPTPQE